MTAPTRSEARALVRQTRAAYSKYRALRQQITLGGLPGSLPARIAKTDLLVYQSLLMKLHDSLVAELGDRVQAVHLALARKYGLVRADEMENAARDWLWDYFKQEIGGCDDGN